MRILYQGLLSSPASWARVGRGYIRALLDLGVSVSAVRTRGFRFDPSFEVDDRVEWLSEAEAKGSDRFEVGLGFLQPPHLDRLVGTRRVNFFGWESDRVPDEWISAMSERLHAVVVPSQFTRRALTDSGMRRDSVAVVPYGYDPDAAAAARQRRTAPGERPFTFLSVAAPHWRKGIRETLLAYAVAFRSSDHVRLRIKTTYDPARSRRRFEFEIPSWRKLVLDCGLDEREAPGFDIEVSSPGDTAMVLEYATSDVYVGPSWGESFGLAHLEASAVGLPIIGTRWSATSELFDVGPDLIEPRVTDAGQALYHPTPGASVAVPNVERLAERMRWHFDHPEESRRVGAELQERTRQWTWRASAEQLLVAMV